MLKLEQFQYSNWLQIWHDFHHLNSQTFFSQKTLIFQKWPSVINNYQTNKSGRALISSSAIWIGIRETTLLTTINPLACKSRATWTFSTKEHSLIEFEKRLVFFYLKKLKKKNKTILSYPRSKIKTFPATFIDRYLQCVLLFQLAIYIF